MKKYAGLIVAVAAVIAAVAGFILLPDTIVTQIGAPGQPSSTMSKYPGLLIPGALAAVFGWLAYKKQGKNFLVAVILLAVLVLEIVLNLTVFA